jgi:hypothetical protein
MAEMIPVTSSNVKELGYDLATNKLYVSFIKSGIYVYDDVPEEIFNEVLNAESVGKAFIAKVKDKYPYSKIGG